jgi:hypothetical protein
LVVANTLMSMNKIHPSWEFMRPNKNEKYQDFRFEEYYKRVSANKKLNHIPKTIFDQWIYYQHQEPNTLNNYAWINYEKIQFEIEEWSYDRFSNVSVIKNFMDYYSDRASYSDFSQFCCIPEDLKYWKENGTWRVPPIILDINLLLSIPSWSDLTAPYQLVEGHTRFGYLQSLKRISDLNKGSIASTHRIYLMKYQ